MKQLAVFIVGIVAGAISALAGLFWLDEHDRNTRWGRLR